MSKINRLDKRSGGTEPVRFNWINGINFLTVACLILINIIAAKKGVSGSLNSQYRIVNLLEQAGRYGCIALMILPVFTKGWEFGFSSVAEILVWIGVTPLLLLLYGFLWLKKSSGGMGVLYALAIVPVVLFLLNGILLRHAALIAAALVFGVCHLWIVRENV